MAHAPPTSGPKATPAQRLWEIAAVVSLLPAAAYFVVLMLALILGAVGPARWLVEHLLDGVWAIPMLWAFVIGGPIVSVISSLILGLSERPGFTVGKVCGVCAWTLLVINLVSCVPFPFIIGIGS